MPIRVCRLVLPALAALSLAGCAAQSTSTAPSPSVRSATTGASAAAKRTRLSSHRSSGATTTAAGRFALITEPRAGVAPVLSALRGARHQVDMVMYEDEDSQVNAALAADEHRGVKVRVLLNGGYYGEGSVQNRAAYSYLRARSVPVKWTPSYFALTHQKTLLVDGRAYILTFNLTPQYYASSRDFGVSDTIAADDAAVRQTFNADWSGQRITAPNGADLLWSPGSEQAQVSLIESAQGFLDIYNEEMDSTAIEQALGADARRGVNVEVTMTYDSSWKGAFAQLSAAGVHVRTYSASAALYIHAKMILTSRRVFLGSQNFSYTSLERNRELGLITSNPTLRASLRRTFDSDYAGARPYTARSQSSGGSPSGSGAPSSSPTGARCSASTSYSSRYADYDVYVHSNQPGQTVTVTDATGSSANYHTDSSGYADVYFRAPASATGETVTVHAGPATCHAKLSP
jgi:phosphatidylserine/phosphatidylglycerophosphate/cardiolipin synthase-like enzyme